MHSANVQVATAVEVAFLEFFRNDKYQVIATQKAWLVRVFDQKSAASNHTVHRAISNHPQIQLLGNPIFYL
jgi:hypothetical protein